MNLEYELRQNLKNGVKTDEPMSLHTTWQVGGTADYFLCPVDSRELTEIVKLSKKYNQPIQVVGNGSNLLVLDGGIRGLVVYIGDAFCYINRTGKGLLAGAGTPMTMLAKTAAQYSLSGIEFAVGIPGSLGGAVIMNAGAFGGYIGDSVNSVSLVSMKGQIVKLSHEQISFGYRTSSLVGMGIVFEISFNLNHGDPTESNKQMEYFLAERRRRHPSLPSCGSVFRNLPGQPAGQIIEQAGAKGLRIGGAEVSTQHANFIVNTGSATASDILQLIKAVQNMVKEKFACELHPEVKIIGEEGS
jgi:UDP-N-acetylmuramate dehydrogenase